MGEGKNFFSREKKFFPSPKPPSFFKKSGVLPLRCRGREEKIFITSILAQRALHV